MKEKTEIRPMKLADFFNLGNLKNDMADKLPIELVENKNIPKAFQIYHKASLLLSLLGLPTPKKIVAFVYLIDGRLEGILFLFIRVDEATLGIFLNKEERNKGRGGDMMKMAIDWTKANNMKLVLNTAGWKKKAIHFYKKYGFKIKKTSITYKMVLEDNTR